MTLLVFGLVIFFAAHSFTMFRDLRQVLVDRIGALPYRGLYSLLSLGGFVLIIIGFGDAPRIELWAPPTWMRYVTILLMLPALVMVIAANMPGYIKAKLKNPMLIGLKTWAFAHLLSNGDLASMLLFGTFLVWAVIDLIAVKRSGRSAVVAQPRAMFDGIALIIGLGVYAVLFAYAHVYIAGLPLMAPG